MPSQEEILKEIQKYPSGILLRDLAESLTYRNDSSIGKRVRTLCKKELVKVEDVIYNKKSCNLIFPIG